MSQCKKESTTAPASTEGALAVVAGRPITGQDLIDEAGWRMANRQEVPAAPELLQEMTQRLALVERARQAGIADEPDTRRRVESLLIARLRERELDAKLLEATVSDEEVAAAFEARRDELTRKGVDRFAILFQAAHAKMSDARRLEARQRLEEALALADTSPAPGGRGPAAIGFGAVAASHSEDQTSRHRGGDIGWIETDATGTRWPEALLAVGRALEKGGRSGIVEGEEGFYVIMKTDTRPGGVPPLAELEPRLRETLLREKRSAIENAFAAEALALAKVEITPGAADKVVLPIPSAPATSPDGPPALPGASLPSSPSR